MQIGIMKVGANITQSSAILTAANFDIFSLAPLLVEGGHTVRVFTRITRNTKLDAQYKLHDYMKVESLDKLDCLLVFNGPINFFGGTEDPGIIKQYELINQYKGKVFYVMTDSRYPFVQLWPLMLLKPWHKKYDKSKIWVHREDIHYLYQGRDIDRLLTITNGKPRVVPVKRKNIHPYPIDWAIMMNNQGHKEFSPISERPIDLIYGGSNRDRNRQNRFEEYYFGTNKDKAGFEAYEELKVSIFGSIKIFGEKNKNGAVPHSQFIKKMESSKSTIIIGDKFYENNFNTLRMYESILAGCLTFIDLRFDPTKSFYGDNKDLRDLMYVDGHKQYLEKMATIVYLDGKQDGEFSKNLQYEQLKRVQNMYSSEDMKSKLNEILS